MRPGTTSAFFIKRHSSVVSAKSAALNGYIATTGGVATAGASAVCTHRGLHVVAGDVLGDVVEAVAEEDIEDDVVERADGDADGAAEVEVVLGALGGLGIRGLLGVRARGRHTAPVRV